MSPARAAPGPEERSANPPSVLTGAALALLSMLPLLLAYEWALLRHPGAARNAGELVLASALAPFGEQARAARWALLALALALAWVRLRGQRARVADGVARIFLEGLAAAVLLGPLLVLGMRLAGRWVAPLEIAWDPVAARAADPVGAALLFGGSAWEELVFRLGGYSFLYWLALRTAQACAAPAPVARTLAEGIGLSGSALLFAAAHVEPWAGRLGVHGQAFEPSLFAWLLLAGLALGLLFRLRGPGVAAWGHGLFNAALWIGIDPGALF